MASKGNSAQGTRSSASTPASQAKRGTKRIKPGSSSSSTDGDLSYLNLDTGVIFEAARTDVQVSLSGAEYDELVGKLDKVQFICDKFSNIETCLTKLDKLDKLDSLEKSIRGMNDKLLSFEQRLLTAESKTKDVEKSAEFISSQFDEVQNCQTATASSVQQHSASISELTAEVAELRQLNDDLKATLLDSKCRDMRDNLLFTNIEDHKTVSDNGKQYEDTEAVLTDFLSTRLNIRNVSFERVHRLSSQHDRQRDWPSPIVAKFSFFKDREKVRRSGYMLKGTSYGIREQFPEEIERKRRELYPLARHFREQNKRVVFVRDRLFVDGREVRAGDVDIQRHRPHTNDVQGQDGAQPRRDNNAWRQGPPRYRQATNQRMDTDTSRRQQTESVRL